MKNSIYVLFLLLITSVSVQAETIALWLFDEPVGLYPSHTMDTSEGPETPLTLGLGGMIVPGKFGNALNSSTSPKLEIPTDSSSPGRAMEFGQLDLPVPDGKTQAPLSWHNANYAAFMTGGERHLRKEVDYVNPTHNRLNLGNFDWTVDFWLRLNDDGKNVDDGVVFEIGNGERGEGGNEVLRLVLSPSRQGFILEQTEVEKIFRIDTVPGLLNSAGQWNHFAFVFEARKGELRHYVNGVERDKVLLDGFVSLSSSEIAYMSLLRDGTWERPLPGSIDELRFSDAVLYKTSFKPPASLAPVYPKPDLVKGPPLLFAPGQDQSGIVPLGGRKHLFIDDALIESSRNISFNVNPPRLTHRVLDDIELPFRKHLTFVDDGEGMIRMFNGGPDDYLMVHTSTDGIHFEAPDTGIHHGKKKNIVIPESTAMGSPMIDPNAPAEHRWKYITGHADRGTYMYTSPDGWKWKRVPTATHSFRSGSQTSFYYDDQRQVYVAYQRTGMTHTRGNATQRAFIITETRDPYSPWPIEPMTQEETRSIARSKRLRSPHPWFLDNGPLTPGDFGIEKPIKFEVIDDFDPEGLGIYVPKAHKYPWAHDTYLAFPLMYLHYEPEDGPPERWILGHPSRDAGSGTVESQLAISRDGRDWHRYPRPAYAGIGNYMGRYVPQAYFAEGMIRRGNEIWQYIYGAGIYHSSFRKDDMLDAVYRVVQRLDGFVSADSPYETHGYIITRPLVFEGNRLVVNIDTDAAGYAQVGFQDAEGQPIPGFGLDNGLYINGDFIEKEVEFRTEGIETTADISELEGRVVKVVIRMRGSKLFALQFLSR